MKIDRIRMDIDKKLAGVIPSVQWDDNMRFIHINIVNGSEAFDLTGYSVKVAGLKPDGTSFFNDVRVVNAQEGFIEVVLTEQMNAAAGSVRCEVKIYSEKGVISTQPFILYVETSVTNKDITSSNEFGALTEALNKVTNMDNKFESLTADTVAKATEKEIQKQIANGTMANLALADNSVEGRKLKNDSMTGDKIKAKSLQQKHLHKNWGQLLHNNSITIDLANKEIRTAKDVWYYSDNHHTKIQINGDKIDLASINTIGQSSYSHVLYCDLVDNTLKFGTLPIANPNVIFAYWYGGYQPTNIMLGSNESKIEIIDTTGKVYKSRTVYFGDLFKEHGEGYINIQTNPEGVADTISIAEGGIYYSYSGTVALMQPHMGESLVPDKTPQGYVRTVYLNKETGVISMCHFSDLELKTKYENVVVFFHFSGGTILGTCKIPTGLVKINGSWATQDMLRPKTVKHEHMDEGIVGYDNLDRQLRTILNARSIQVNFNEMKIKVTDKHTYVITETHYRAFRGDEDSKLPDINIPAEAINFNVFVMYSLWYSYDEKTLKFTRATEVPSKGSMLLAMFYQGKPFIQNLGDGIQVIDRHGKEVITSFGALERHINNNLAYPLNYATIHSGNLNINSKEYKVTCNIGLLVAKGIYTSIVHEVSWADTPNPDYMRFIGVDLSTKQLKVYRMGEFEVKNPNLVFVCSIYQGKVGHYLSPDNISLNGIAISKTITSCEMERPIFYSNKPAIEITYDKDNYTINVKRKAGTYIMLPSRAAGAGGPAAQDGEPYVYQCTSANISYAYKLYMLKSDTTKFIIKTYNAELTSKEQNEYAFICMFDANKVYGFNSSASNLLLNGKTPILGHENVITNGNYDWETNRFVIPKDLYLVKDVPYSIFAPNFNINQLVDNDDCLFEIALPTKVVQFEQTADIQVPFAFEKGKPFRTRVAGKYKYSNSVLTKDMNLHIADPSLITKKQVKILCIGDSITQSNYSKNLKWQLSQFGISATMLGSLVNGHEHYSYGITQYLQNERGEGRGGWRLTDFTCTTPLKEGGYYLPNFVMMNPETRKFDFSYYMKTRGYSDVDFVIINIGTNDISGYHYAGSVQSNDAYNKIRYVQFTDEYLNSNSEYYLGKQYKILIDSIHRFNPNIKIAINPPMTNGISNFIVRSMQWAEVVQHEFKDYPNVYMLGSYLGQGQLSVGNIESVRDRLTKVNEKNETLKSASPIADVHVNGMGQLIHTLYPASWIVNMCL